MDYLDAITTEVTTSYIPGEDVTVVWQHMYVLGECIQRTITGWYYGKEDAKLTKQFSELPLSAQLF